MGTLYDLCAAAGRQLETRHAGDPIGLVRAKGELAAKAGFLVTLVGPSDPSDPMKIESLRRAAAELGLNL